jgi:DNA polymerase-3 subunit epsilon
MPSPDLPSDQSGYAVVDLETTGLRPTDTILQMAVVLTDVTGRITRQWSTHVRPPRFMSTDLGPRHIHGIGRRHLLFAPRLNRAMHTLAELTAGRIVVAHNAPFDTRFLRTAADNVGIPLGWAGVLCTLDLSRRLDPSRHKNHRLTSLCEDYGIRLDQAHDALHDARATAELLPHLLREHAIVSIDQTRDYFVS